MYTKKQYNSFMPKELKPTGWLKNQLRIQAEGLCGNLDKVWPDVRDSAWIGGKYEGWERVPYWLDGFIPMAYLLEDQDMIARAKKYIDAIIAFQRDDGWICPCKDDERGNYDVWAVLLISKVLVVYADCSGDERIEGVLKKCLMQFSKHLNASTLRCWGAARWFEGLIAIFWLYERCGDKWLLTLAKKLRICGFDWRAAIESGFIYECNTGWDYYSHVVNIAMMLKSEALYSQISDLSPSEFGQKAFSWLEKHMTAAGHFNGDECLSGNSPVQGAELCSVVETMFSYECLFAITADTVWLDRLEKLTYNSLPAAISPDMWSHQYNQMINQVAAYPMAKQPFRTNNNVSHTFGLEPNFGCCTANFGQGWPKAALTTFMRSEDGIASCILAPSVVETEIGENRIKCELVTDYPFRNELKYIVTAEKPTKFTLKIRIPSFVSEAYVDGEKAERGVFAKIDRVWEGRSEINVRFEFKTELKKQSDEMYCLSRGVLLYSIPVKERWERVEYSKNGIERKFPYCDYYVYPESKWNYAFADKRFAVNEKNTDMKNPFNPQNSPIEIEAAVCEVEWGFHNGHCDELPVSEKPIGDKTTIKMIPYGCTNLRMTQMPYIGQDD